MLIQIPQMFPIDVFTAFKRLEGDAPFAQAARNPCRARMWLDAVVEQYFRYLVDGRTRCRESQPEDVIFPAEFRALIKAACPRPVSLAEQGGNFQTPRFRPKNLAWQ